MIDKLFNRFTLGFGAGYVLGARAGRERYEQLVAVWERVAGSPVVKQAAQQAAEQGKQLIGEGKERLSGQLQALQRPGRVGEVMTPMPTRVRASQTVAEAASNMRQIDDGSMIVVDDAGKVIGSIGDLAVERDPRSALADISSEPPNR